MSVSRVLHNLEATVNIYKKGKTRLANILRQKEIQEKPCLNLPKKHKLSCTLSFNTYTVHMSNKEVIIDFVLKNKSVPRNSNAVLSNVTGRKPTLLTFSKKKATPL